MYTEMNVNAEGTFRKKHHCQKVYLVEGEGVRRVMRRMFSCYSYTSVLFEVLNTEDIVIYSLCYNSIII